MSMILADHRIHTDRDGISSRARWECSCGAAGSAPSETVDLASDKHIREGESRVDTNRPL